MDGYREQVEHEGARIEQHMSVARHRWSYRPVAGAMTRTGTRAPRCLRCRSRAATLLPARKPWGPRGRSRRARGWPNARCGGHRAMRLTAVVGDHGESVPEQRAERAVRSQQTERVRRTASASWRAALSAWRGAPPSVSGRPDAAERELRDHALSVVDHVITISFSDSLLVDPSVRAVLARAVPTPPRLASGGRVSGPLVDG